MASRKRYLSQGDMDGACLLYSIANAKVALSGRKPTLSQWSYALEVVPFSSDLLDGTVGTKNYDDNSSLLEFAVQNALDAFGMESKVSVNRYPKAKRNDLAGLLRKDTVLILLVEGGEHWVCVVDIDESEGKLLCACSDQTDGVSPDLKASNGMRYNRAYELKSFYHHAGVISVRKRA